MQSEWQRIFRSNPPSDPPLSWEIVKNFGDRHFTCFSAGTPHTDCGPHPTDSGWSRDMLAPTPPGPNAILTRLSEQERAVADLIAGRSSLLEAAGRFRAAAGARSGADGEEACRTVIGWVHLALRDRPERADRVAGRLERELQSSLARFGRLPVPA
jgi:hypothetical protein